MRRALSIIFCALAGFFVYGASFIGFLRLPEPATAAFKLAILGGTIALGAIAQVSGSAIVGFRHWRKETGLMLLWSEGFAAFAVLTFACLFLDEEVRRAMAPDGDWLLGDYVIGSACIVMGGTLGALLFVSSKRRPPEVPAAASEMSRPCRSVDA